MHDWDTRGHRTAEFAYATRPVSIQHSSRVVHMHAIVHNHTQRVITRTCSVNAPLSSRFESIFPPFSSPQPRSSDDGNERMASIWDGSGASETLSGWYKTTTERPASEGAVLRRIQIFIPSAPHLQDLPAHAMQRVAAPCNQDLERAPTPTELRRSGRVFPRGPAYFSQKPHGFSVFGR